MKYIKSIIVVAILTLLFLGFDDKKEEIKISKEEEMLAGMSLEEKIGQMFMVRCPEEEQIEAIKEYHLGGYILYSRDFDGYTKEEVTNRINSYQDTSSIPLFIGVDEEGGSVVRVSKYPQFRSEPFKSIQELYQLGGFDLIYNDAIEKSRFLKELGINVNFAPVADIAKEGDYIYKRTFGGSVSQTAEYVGLVVDAMNKEKIGSVLKHFPGYGANINTHTDISIDNKDYDYLLNNDIVPFKKGIEENASMIMVSHNIQSSIDDVPCSLSTKVHNILREDLGYDGIIITDDLTMDAIGKYTNNELAVIRAINAGNDIICTSEFVKSISLVIEEVKKGSIKEDRINDSVLRILRLKNKLGLLN